MNNVYQVLLWICAILIVNGLIQLLRAAARSEGGKRKFNEDVHAECHNFQRKHDKRGSITVRPGDSLEKRLRYDSETTGKTINSIVCNALSMYYAEKDGKELKEGGKR